MAAYQRAFSRYENGEDEDRFESIQNYARAHLLKTLGCTITDVEKLLQWSWIPRNQDGYRITDQPLRVPVPLVIMHILYIDIPFISYEDFLEWKSLFVGSRNIFP